MQRPTELRNMVEDMSTYECSGIVCLYMSCKTETIHWTAVDFFKGII
jgi:hypothetical protein